VRKVRKAASSPPRVDDAIPFPSVALGDGEGDVWVAAMAVACVVSDEVDSSPYPPCPWRGIASGASVWGLVLSSDVDVEGDDVVSVSDGAVVVSEAWVGGRRVGRTRSLGPLGISVGMSAIEKPSSLQLLSAQEAG
jgi:hypothetical protein